MQKVVQLLRTKRFKRINIPIYFVLTLFISLLAGFANAQDLLSKQINFQVQDASIKEALLEIQKQSGIKVVYGEAINQYPNNKISAKNQAITIKQALTKVLDDTNLQYEHVGNYITIKNKPTAQTPSSPNAAAGQGQQQGSGSLKGRIVEFETSNPLPGATVRILGTQIAAQSDESGYYTLSGVPAGNRSLEVSFIGYSTEVISTNIRAGQTATYDVKLQGSNTLEEVVISGIGKTRAPVAHTTDRQVIAEIKAASVVVSGISSEQISKSADRNAAEVVARISGVSVRDDKFVVIRGMNERYNLTYLNGNVAPSTELYSRAFALDLLPTRIIDRVLVYKSPAPDLLADMTGGTVKIFTKDAKAVKHFDVEVQLGYRPNTTFNKDFMTYHGGKWDFLGFDDGTRSLPSVVPGYGDFTKASISQKEYADNFTSTLQYRKMSGLPLGQLTANYYNAYRVNGRTLSLLGSLSYKNESRHNELDRMQAAYEGDGTGMRLHNLTGEAQSQQNAQLTWLQNFTYSLTDSSSIQLKNFLLQQGQSAVIDRTQYNKRAYGTFTDADYTARYSQPLNVPGWYNPNNSETDERNIILNYSQRFLYSGNLSGQHRLKSNIPQQLSWNAGYMFSRQDIPDQRIIRFVRNDNSYYRLLNPVVTSPYQWLANTRNTNDMESGDRSVDLGIISRTWARNNEHNVNASADYNYRWKPWAEFKAGTYQQWKKRALFRRVYTVNEGDLNDVGYPNNDVLASDGRYMDYDLVFFKEQDLGKVWSDTYLRDDGSALKVFDRTSGSDAYTATEQNNSGYVAMSLKPWDEKLDIYGGLRVEYNRQKVAGAIPQGQQTNPTHGGLNQPVLVDIKRLDWLPSVNISYRPTEQWVVRGAYGHTLNRPEFRELSPYSELDHLNNQVIYGNENLLPSSAKNADIRVEWYPREEAAGNTVSIGAFYKKMKDPIERILYRDLTFSTPTFISFNNAQSGEVKGIELDIRYRLDVLDIAFLRQLSLIANGSFMDSKVTKVSERLREDNAPYTRQMQGQAPYIVNAGLYYENIGSGTKLSLIYNQIGPRIYAAAEGTAFAQAGESGGNYARAGSAGSLIELKTDQLDFALTQRIVTGLQAKFAVQNILNHPIQIAEDENFTYKYEKAAVVQERDPGAGGAIFSGDQISSSYKRYPSFNLALTYSF